MKSVRYFHVSRSLLTIQLPRLNSLSDPGQPSWVTALKRPTEWERPPASRFILRSIWYRTLGWNGRRLEGKQLSCMRKYRLKTKWKKSSRCCTMCVLWVHKRLITFQCCSVDVFTYTYFPYFVLFFFQLFWGKKNLPGMMESVQKEENY